MKIRKYLNFLIFREHFLQYQQARVSTSSNKLQTWWLYQVTEVTPSLYSFIYKHKQNQYGGKASRVANCLLVQDVETGVVLDFRKLLNESIFFKI